MENLFVEPLLKVGEEHLALLLFEPIGPWLDDKVTGRELAVIEQCYDDRVYNHRPKFFDEIESQGGTAIERI